MGGDLTGSTIFSVGAIWDSRGGAERKEGGVDGARGMRTKLVM